MSFMGISQVLYSEAPNVRIKACVFSYVWFFVTPQTVARQAPLTMEFSRQEY